MLPYGAERRIHISTSTKEPVNTNRVSMSMVWVLQVQHSKPKADVQIFNEKNFFFRIQQIAEKILYLLKIKELAMLL